MFLETVKTFLSNIVQSSERIKLAEEDDTLITNDAEVVMKLSNFFSNVAINLKTPKFENFDPLSENTDHLTLKAFVKYRKQPSIMITVSKYTKECFSFNTVIIEDSLKEISMLGS